MCTIAPLQFVSFLSRFRADNPGVEVTLLEAVPDQLCDLLLKGEMDVALMARPDGFPHPLRASELYSERFVIACSAGHRFASRTHVPMADLDGEFYLSRINCEFYDVLGDLCRGQGVNLVKSYRSDREDWILTMVAAGLGVCFLPEYTAAFAGVIGCPRRGTSRLAQRLPRHRRRPSCILPAQGFHPSRAAVSLANSASRRRFSVIQAHAIKPKTSAFSGCAARLKMRWLNADRRCGIRPAPQHGAAKGSLT